MSIILRIGAVKSDLSHSIDVTSDVDLENTDDSCYHPVTTQTYPGCYGLPYQDHNYGAPPPPTPPLSPPPPPPLPPPPPPQIIIPPTINGHVEIEEETTTTVETTSTDTADDSITRCVCEFEHDDGYMICCDKCSVWQHIDCMLLDRTNIPDTYYCEMCEPRIIDVLRAKQIQTRRREEIAALVDTSATDTDPEEEANRLGSLGQIPSQNKKRKQQKKFKLKDNLSLKQRRMKKDKKDIKKDKENKNKDANRKLLKTLTPKKPAKIKVPKKTPVPPVDTQNENAQDAWDCTSRGSPDKYELARQNEYSTEVHDILSSKHFNGQHSPDKYTCSELIVKLCCVTEVKKGRKGLISIDRIGSNQPVIEYTGKVMLREQFDKESHFFKQLNPFVFFYSNFENLDLCIDSSTYGSDARFVRRSCAPTAEVRHVVEYGQLRFIVYSRKEISKGAEITIPFDFRYQDCNYCVDCACLRVNCPVAKYFKKVQASKNKPVRKKRRSGSNKLTTPNIVNIKTNMAFKEEEEPVVNPVILPEESPVVDVVKDENVPPEVSLSPKITVKSEVRSPVKNPVTYESESAPEEDLDKSRKMTREERKMEAIMKAFEKLEKRQERKKDTHCKVEIPKTSLKEKEKPQEVKEKVQATHEKKRKTKVKEKGPETKEKQQEIKQEPDSPEVRVVQPASPPPPPPPDPLPPPLPPEVPTEDQEKASKESEEVKEKIVVLEEKVEKPKTTSRKRRRSQACARRRTRQNSSSSEAVLSHDESSSSQLSTTSCTPTDVLASGSISPMKGFKFLKTKKHLMNEWLSEKSQDEIGSPSKTDPLEIQVDDEARFVTCLPSPRNTMDHLRRNSQSGGCSGKATGDNVSGSAKKRWLRQAMFETPEPGSSKAMSPGHSSGNASPVSQQFNGSCSPNPSVSVHTRHISGSSSPNPSVSMPSPGGSPPTDFVTPLKKRRLARESLSLEQPATPTTSTPSLSLTPTVGLDNLQAPVPFRAALEAFKNKNGYNSLSIPSDDAMEEEEPIARKSNTKNDDSSDNVEPSSADVPDSSVNEQLNISDECLEIKSLNKTSDTTTEEGDSGYISSSKQTKTSESDTTERLVEAEPMDAADSVEVVDRQKIVASDESVLTVKKKGSCNSETSVNTADSSEMCESVKLSKIKTSCDEVDEDNLVHTNEALNSSSSSSHSDFENKSVEVSVSTTDSDKFSSEVDRVTSNSSSNIVLYSPQSSSSTRTLESDSKETESDTTSAIGTVESCRNNFISPSDSAISSSVHKQKLSDIEDSVGSSNTAIYSSSSEIVQSTSHDSYSSSVTKFPSDSTESNCSVSGMNTSEIMADCSESVSRNSELVADCSESRLRNLEIVADSTNTSHDSHNTADTFPSSWNHCDSSISSFRDSALTVPQHYFSDSMNNCDVSSSTNILFKASSEVSSSFDNTSNEAQSTQVPAKKKVSLLEYRKRLKEKKDVKPDTPVPSTTSFTTSATSSVTRSTTAQTRAILTSRIPKLDPLPLFKPNSPEKEKKSALNGDPFSPPWRSKTMSLSERLRLEFGLDDSEEDDKTEQATGVSEQKEVNNQQGYVPTQAGNVPGSIHQPSLLRAPAPPQPGHMPRAAPGQRISALLSLPHYPDQRLREARPPNGIATPPPPHVQGPPHRPGIPPQSSQQYGRGPPNQSSSQNQSSGGFPSLSSEQNLPYQATSSSQHHQPCQVIEYNHQTRSPTVMQPGQPPQYSQPPPPPPPRYSQASHTRGRNYMKKRGRHFR